MVLDRSFHNSALTGPWVLYLHILKGPDCTADLAGHQGVEHGGWSSLAAYSGFRWMRVQTLFVAF